ncbi:MAG: diguanylate cyclase [Clostridia bacterium]
MQKHGFIRFFVLVSALVVAFGAVVLAMAAPPSMAALMVALLMLVLSMLCAWRMALSSAKRRSLEVIADAIPSGVFRLNADEFLTITYANSAFYALYGYPTEREAQQDGLTHAAFTLDQAAFARLYQTIQTHIAQKEYRFDVEIREHNRLGAPLWVLSRMRYDPETRALYGTAVNTTDRKQMEEQLRISEEEYRIAVTQSEKYILRYEIKRKTIHNQPAAAALFGIPECMEDVPESVLALGIVAPESAKNYAAFYAAMQRGNASGDVMVRMKNHESGKFCWYRGTFTTIFDDQGAAQRSIVSFSDVTEQREKELAYEKVRQELASVPPSEIATFDCNLTRDTTDNVGGALFQGFDWPTDASFDARTARFAPYIHPEDRRDFLAFMNRDRLMAAFKANIYSGNIDCRESFTRADYAWMRASIQLVAYPGYGDIKAFVVLRNIDAAKREDLAIRERLQTDALTGALNRVAFAQALDRLLHDTDSASQHALVMVDIDNFKYINDTFGHAAGDQALVAIVKSLKRMLRAGDLIGRIGGDEFVVCLNRVLKGEMLEKCAQLVCQIISFQPNPDIAVSGSVGVALYPRDGASFDELYQKADIAMYHAKQQGKNRYTLYSPDMGLSGFCAPATPIDDPSRLARRDASRKEVVRQSRRLQATQDRVAHTLQIPEDSDMITFEWDLRTHALYADPGLDQYALCDQALSTLLDQAADVTCVHPDDVARLKQHFLEAFKFGARYAEIPLRLKKTDGRYAFCHLGTMLVRDDEGEPQRAIGAILKTS